MEMATKLLEKDVHEKQDTIVTLRRQLDDIKAINLEMYNKLQVGPVCSVPKLQSCLGVGKEYSGRQKTMRVENLKPMWDMKLIYVENCDDFSVIALVAVFWRY